MPKASHIAAALVLFSTSALAADPVPVIELQVEDSASSLSQQNTLNIRSQGSGSEMLILLEQLQDEVRSLRGLVEQQQHQIRQMEQQQRDRYRDLDRRIAQAGSRVPATGVAPASSSADSGEVTSTAPSTSGSVAINDIQAYQDAIALVRKKAYTEAFEAFSSFIELYPESVRLPNAYYWLGEVNLAEQKLEPARAAFEHVLENYPDNRKVADSTYKLGVIHHQLGNQDKAKELFQQTVSRFPDSSAAKFARDYLKR
ncbi:MAG: tol-pal system protein YbgF [Amphritea sp.]|nr:tol-pal system protein YbgF [Amphritea sp.]